MPNYNKVILVGHLTRDPQLSYTPNQTSVCQFGIAVNHKYGDKGDKKEEVCFVDCVAFGKTSDNINKYYAKGRAILVEGRLAQDQWTAQDGTKRNKHKIVIERFCFIENSEQTEPPIEQDKRQNNDDIPF